MEKSGLASREARALTNHRNNKIEQRVADTDDPADTLKARFKREPVSMLAGDGRVMRPPDRHYLKLKKRGPKHCLTDLICQLSNSLSSLSR